MSRVPVLCPILVGRDELLELVDYLTAEAVDGRGRTLLLSGQAGLGKTRLIRATLGGGSRHPWHRGAAPGRSSSS
jgi:hypothetical protein